ncbi:hypothetical protein A6V36_18135 [Paraburkholderia ginsengiterrae]|uniref:Extradiol ring-cleavage dioxygenase class III enzyme subunit B domain-containing protein n=1 Tax=Paraburkholderia ginsengiterrae TaxID=1462993 RepID=A0A1A9MWT7_9BURK|nr:hypothetical protein [Paraburkholderia ginsengiterrae]OAJ52047.1 hypothetical protein A6V37_10315 [Paraburkholderia ginsengiterrae]OAJ63409.1 hypothetical protein A6V36_18135 [Paraburkholderia ginsengiterrae]
MGQIVSAAATSHTFGVTDDVETQAQRIFDGISEIGRAIRASRPDVLVIASSDHLNDFSLDFQIPLAVGIADQWTPLGDLGVPRTHFTGHREFASGLLNYCADNGFDLAGVENVRLDHGMAMPNAIINLDCEMPIVPIFINTVMTPAPSCARSYELGRCLNRYVRDVRPDGERVAVLGTGGLSHWICLPDSGRVNVEWDEEVMNAFVSGDSEKIIGLTRDVILRDGGNGGLEIASWAFMAGASASNTGRIIYYEEMRPWWTGMGGILMSGQTDGPN